MHRAGPEKHSRFVTVVNTSPGTKESPKCGLFFSDDGALAVHHEAFHAVKTCDKCGKDVLQSNFKKHLNSHEITKGYKNVISKGKVKAKATNNVESVPKVAAKLTGYRLFLQTKRPEIRNQNPDATPQEMIKILNQAWNSEKLLGNKEAWDKKAKEDGERDNSAQTEENHFIQKCNICGLMIANLNVHMTMNHSQDTGTTHEAPNEDEPATETLEAPTTQLEVAEETEELEAEQEVVPDNTAVIEATDGESTQNNFKPGDLVMVLRKTLHWPAKVVSNNFNLIEVMIFDKTKTKEIKQPKFLVPFTPDVAACEGRGAVWVKAWKEAKKEYETKFATE